MVNANPYRLPRTVTPDRYELTLTPDLDQARFAGEEKISVSIHEPVSEIVLNCAELEILATELIGEDGSITATNPSLDEEAERLTLSLEKEVPVGLYTLHVTFAGELNDKLHGFYRSTFKDDHGIERVIATTQFEAVDARKAFPCWDEPDFKAVFSITLIVDEDLAAFSNAEVMEDTALGTGKRQVDFADTPRMSTYLVAFVVGPLAATPPVDVDGVPLRVACVPGRQHLAQFALEVGAAALRFFTGYFGIPYPAAKLDMLALPDFASGAMENLGCVTYRETALLIDPERSSRREAEYVAEVVSHEIAHMWFGDLVTMKWWNGLWLNEAFATFMANLFVDHFRPEWERWSYFNIFKSSAYTVDSLTSTRPIEFKVEKPEDAEAMFDVLTYEKGAGVLRMLEQHLGSEVFRRGISAYLKENSFANAETTDLWDALETSSGEPVRALMDSWIFQAGYPLVQVEKDGSSLRLRQHIFTYLPQPDNESPLWHVPMSMRTSSGNEHKFELTEASGSVPLENGADHAVVNVGSNGYYRVAYSTELLSKLLENVSGLDARERFGLANDTWASCVAGTTTPAEVLKLVSYFGNDDDPNVWGAILAPFRLFDKLVDDATEPRMRAFVRDFARPAFEKLGWYKSPGEHDRVSTLRATLVSAMGATGQDAEVQAEAARLYEAWEKDPSALDSNLVSTVEDVLATTEDPAHYDRFLARFRSDEVTPQERINALHAFASFTTPALLERTLEMIESGEVRTQDAPYTVRAMLTRRKSAQRVWGWFEDNWNGTVSRFPENSIARVIEGAASQADPAFAARVQSFMAKHPVPQAQKSVDQTCERLTVNARFYERVKPEMHQLFA